MSRAVCLGWTVRQAEAHVASAEQRAVAQLGDFQVPVTVLLAGFIAVTVPAVIGFFLAQRYIVSGLVQGASAEPAPGLHA